MDLSTTETSGMEAITLVTGFSVEDFNNVVSIVDRFFERRKNRNRNKHYVSLDTASHHRAWDYCFEDKQYITLYRAKASPLVSIGMPIRLERNRNFRVFGEIFKRKVSATVVYHKNNNNF